MAVELSKNVFGIDTEELTNILGVRTPHMFKEVSPSEVRTVIEEYALDRAYDIVLFLSKSVDFENLHIDLRPAVIEVALNLVVGINPINNVYFLHHLNPDYALKEDGPL